MRDRHKSLQRLLAVKSQLSQIEEARLADILRRRQALAEERNAMFDLLGDGAKTDSLLLGLASRHLIHTARGEAELEAAEKLQTRALALRQAQKKALEKILDETRLAMERDEERKRLLDMGERLADENLATRGRTSLG